MVLKLMNNFRISDDALHFYDSADYFEWWYCDARFDNGYSCVLVYYWMSPYKKPHSPVLHMYIYTPEGKRLVGFAEVDKLNCSCSPSRCNVKMGNSSLRQEGDKYIVSMRAYKIGADLTYHRRVPGWKQNGTGYLYERGDKKQGWIIAAPRSDVEGTLYIDGTSIPVKGGLGYHDKNFGNCKFHECFRSWHWGRLYDDRFTLIYYWLLPMQKNEPVTSRLLLALDNKPVLVTNKYSLSIAGEETCSKTGNKIPSKLVLKDAGDGSVQFKCDISTSIVDCEKVPNLSEIDQYYWRSMGSHTIKAKIKGESIRSSGKLLNEYFVLT